MPTSPKFTSIDQYIKTFPQDVQKILQKVRQTIHTAAPEATETISYQMPTFTQNGRVLVYFAAWKSHLGFYATPTGNEAFRKELAPYQSAKGSVRFPFDEPIPYELITKMTVFQMEENLKKPAKK